MSDLIPAPDDGDTALLLISGGAKGPKEVGLFIQRLEAVAEAVKALAVAEGWRYVDHTVGGTVFFERQDDTWRLSLARALLAAGPEWDWREPKEPTNP